MQEKKAAQLGKRLFAKSAGSRSGSRYAVYSEKSEVREETVMEHAWDLEAKHQTSHWRSANGALRAHLTSGKNSSKDRSRNGAQAPSGHDGNVIADDGKLKAIR